MSIVKITDLCKHDLSRTPVINTLITCFIVLDNNTNNIHQYGTLNTGCSIRLISRMQDPMSRCSTLNKKINVYSFALQPEEHQPTGTCNFSRIDNAKHFDELLIYTDEKLNVIDLIIDQNSVITSLEKEVLKIEGVEEIGIFHIENYEDVDIYYSGLNGVKKL